MSSPAVPSTLPPRAWEHGDPGSAARRLLETAEQIASGGSGGPASLIWQSVAVWSRHRGDTLLAKALATYGAEVTFIGPAVSDEGDPRWAPVSAETAEILRRERPELLVGVWHDGHHPTGLRCAGLARRVETVDELHGAPLFGRVIAIDAAPDDPEPALAAIAELAELVVAAGELHLLWTEPIAPATRAAIERGAALIGLNAMPDVEPATPADDLVADRLALLRLSAPMGEFPGQWSEQVHGAATMAHARSRLEFASTFVAGADVLEAGCGAALGARMFIEHGARRVVGIDASDDALACARAERLDDRIELQRWDLDVTPLPFGDASFDVVVCVEVLEHIRRHEPVIAEFDRILRPGGRLIVSVPDDRVEAQWVELNRCRNVFHLDVPDRPTFRALLHGFDHVAFYRQFDVVASLFIADTQTRPAGEYVTDGSGLPTEPAEVIAAVCTKAPATAPPAVSARLRLFDNDLQRQIAWRSHLRRLEVQLLVERQRAWHELNRQATARVVAREEEAPASTPELQDTVETAVSTGTAEEASEPAPASLLDADERAESASPPEVEPEWSSPRPAETDEADETTVSTAQVVSSSPAPSGTEAELPSPDPLNMEACTASSAPPAVEAESPSPEIETADGAVAAPDEVAEAVELFDGGGVIACAASPVGIPWLDELARHIVPLLRALRRTEIRPDAPCWRIDEHEGLVPLAEAPERVVAVLFPGPSWMVWTRALVAWRRRGAREFWFCGPAGWERRRPMPLLAVRAGRLAWRRGASRIGRLTRVAGTARRAGVSRAAAAVRRLPRPAPERQRERVSVLGLWREWVARDNAIVDEPVRLPLDRPLRVVQHIGALSPGGAERQLCNLSVELERRGVEGRVLTVHPQRSTDGHYRHLLASEGVESGWIGEGADPAGLDLVVRALIDLAPDEIRADVERLAAELHRDPPDILHCWLDHPNIIGGLAGLAAGVPRILLSTRNANPTFFPRLLAPYLEPWYGVLANSRRVHLLANSRSGGQSYIDWLKLPGHRVHVVYNGLRFDHFPEPSDEARRAARAQLGIEPDDRVVCGIFRLDDEKRPDLFLDVVERLRERVDRLRVLLAGVGPLEQSVRHRIHRSGLEEIVTLLGRRRDVDNVLLASDAMLLTSTMEGCPNVALEAQALEVPVVATAVGGTVEVVVSGRTGLLVAADDAAGMADALRRILTDEALRRRLGRAGRRHVTECFTVDQMVDRTTAVYRHMLTRTVDDQPVMSEQPAWIDEDAPLIETVDSPGMPAESGSSAPEQAP